MTTYSDPKIEARHQERSKAYNDGFEVGKTATSFYGAQENNPYNGKGDPWLRLYWRDGFADGWHRSRFGNERSA